MPADPVVFLTPVPGEMVPERNADPWPKNLEGPDGLSLRFQETDGNELAIYLNGDEQVDVGRWSDGTYRMDTQNG